MVNFKNQMLSSDDNFCEKLVKEDIYYFEFMDGCKTQAMCDYAVEKDPWCLEFVPVDLMTQPMCEKAVEKDPRCIMFVRRMFKTLAMCEKAVSNMAASNLDSIPDWVNHGEEGVKGSFSLEDASSCFISLEMYEKALSGLAYIDSYRAAHDIIVHKFIFNTIIESVRQQKALKRKLKEKLLPIAWHPSRVVEWCFDEDNKKIYEDLS